MFDYMSKFTDRKRELGEFIQGFGKHNGRVIMNIYSLLYFKKEVNMPRGDRTGPEGLGSLTGGV